VEQPPYAPSPCSDSYPCNEDVSGWEARIRVPPGFQDRYFARIDGNPTSITFGPDNQLYVAALQGTIYRIDGSGNATAYVGGLNTPTGIAFRPGTSDLYVSSRVRNEIFGGEAQVSLVQGGGIRQLIGGLPCCYAGMHAANGIAFGPDGMGYVGVGGRADHGELPDGSLQQDTLHPLEATILRFSPDGAAVEPFAMGFRNPYDIAWDANGQLYATDNAPDYGPPEELHRVVPGGRHGYPWFDCDICFKPPADVQIVPPIYTFVPHASPTGITVYLANQFPGYYNSIFLTLWSSFPGAQKVVKLGPGGVGATNFAMGFAQPIDVAVGPEGSLYVADFATGIIFRISYAD
jgi:glucose/arabinose dehydrogenase